VQPDEAAYGAPASDYRASHRFADPPPAYPEEQESEGGRICSILSCVFGGIAFLFCPPLFGIAGLALGIVGVSISRDRVLGVLGILLSVAGMFVGMVLGATLVNGLK
jgi:hypothetical protein